MKKVAVMIAITVLLWACHARKAGDQLRPAALKTAELQRARKAAEQDRIEAEQQLSDVRARTQNHAQDKPKK